MARRRPYTRPKNGKLQLLVRVHPGPGGLKTTMRDKTVTDAEIDTWVTEQRAKFGTVPEVAGGLRASVGAYLETRTAMPTLAQHTAHLELWCRALGGDRPPLSVTTDEITRVVDGWMKDDLGNDTIRKRRSALRTFYSRMYPKTLSPVKGSLNPTAPKPEHRELSYLDIDAAITAMPTYQTGNAQRQRRQLSLAKIRLRLMADTGLPPGMVGKIQPEDWTLAGTLRVAGREKGDGIEPRTIALTPDGLKALKAFHEADAYGPFALAACNRAFKAACKRIGLDPRNIRQYDLRHSFLSQLYRVTKDEATVQRLGLHAPGSRVTARYTQAAHAEVDRAAAQAFSAALAELRAKPRLVPKKLPKVAQHGKGV
jgi:integrase